MRYSIFQPFRFFLSVIVAVLYSVIFLQPAQAGAYQFTTSLEPGDEGAQVTALQQVLQGAGFYTHDEITGYYGLITMTSVQRMQTIHNIVTSGTPQSTGFGRVGPQTRIILNSIQESNISAEQAANIDIAAVSIPLFLRDLQWGMEGEDVRQLQIFLNDQGFFVSDFGPGSPGNETTVFQTKTQFALIRFQRAKGIVPAQGFLGTETKKNVVTDTFLKAVRRGVTDFSILVPGETAATNKLVSIDTTKDVSVETPGTQMKSKRSGGGSGNGSSQDAAAPNVSVTAPTNSATVSGVAVTVSADASDDTNVVGVQFVVDGVHLSSEDTTAPYSVSWDTTAIADGVHTLEAVARDEAGNYATSTSVLVVVSNNGFTITNQTLAFGALTLAGAGGVAPTVTGGTVTSASIDGGNAAGHWQIAADGTITPTIAGDAADLNAGPYLLVVTVGDGVITDTATITITTDALTYDVRTRVQLQTAFAAAEALSSTTAYTIYVRDDAVIAGDSGDNDYIRVNGIEMDATLIDANNGASEAAYDYAAVASFSGGSIHLTARTPYEPEIDGRLHFVGVTGVRVSGLTFVHVPDSDSYNRDDGGPNSDSTAAASLAQISLTDSVTYPAESSLIISDNKFGGLAVNNNPLRWGKAVVISAADQIVVEDNEFNGVFNAVDFASVRRGAARRNEIQNVLADGVRSLGNATADLVAFTESRIEFTSNVIWNMNEDADWSGQHSDGIQVGTIGDEVDRDLFIKRNYLYLDVPPLVYPGETTERNTQGIFMNNLPVTVENNGVVAENFVMSTALAGIAVHRGSLEVRNNTVIKDTLNAEPGANPDGVDVRVFEGTHTIQDNIIMAINDEGGVFAQNDNYFLDHDSTAGTADSYFDTFAGPFTVGANGPTWNISTSSASALVAGVDNVFAPQAGSLAAGRGHTTGLQDRIPDGLSFADLSNQATSTLVYSNQQIAGISNQTYVTPTSLEWGVAATSDFNDVASWNSGQGRIDNNEYLHLRQTTAVSGAATTTGTIQVGTATTSWSVGTIAGAYSAQGVEFDGANDSLTTTSFTGAASQEGTISIWLYQDEMNWPSADRLMLLTDGAGNDRLELRSVSNGRVGLFANNAAGSNIITWRAPSATFATSTWYHVIVSYDLANGQFAAYADDTVLGTSPSPLTDDTIPALGRAGVGSTDTAGALWAGHLADVFYDPTYVDLSVEANRREFISAAGKPVDLGADGSTPFGSQPEIFLSGATTNWHTNKGAGGGFTEGGELTDAPSSPSD